MCGRLQVVAHVRCFRHVHQEDLAAATAAKAKPGEGSDPPGSSPRRSSLAGGLLWRTSSQLGGRERSASRPLEDGSDHEVPVMPTSSRCKVGKSRLGGRERSASWPPENGSGTEVVMPASSRCKVGQGWLGLGGAGLRLLLVVWVAGSSIGAHRGL